MAARVERSDSWDLDGVEARVLCKELVRFFERQRMNVRDEEDDEPHSLRADQGTQLGTRLLGGWFVPASWLPKMASITFDETRTGLRVRASIEETLGFGFMDPILAGKYEKFFDAWLDDLDALLTQLHRDRPSA